MIGARPEIDGIKEKNREHPYGDAGQLILLGSFRLVWLGGSGRLTEFIKSTPESGCQGLVRLLNNFKAGFCR